MYGPITAPIDTAQRRPVPLVVPTWATYSELKKEIEREYPNLTAAEHETAMRELCSALGL